jgi:hypothetical protein
VDVSTYSLGGKQLAVLRVMEAGPSNSRQPSSSSHWLLLMQLKKLSTMSDDQVHRRKQQLLQAAQGPHVGPSMQIRAATCQEIKALKEAKQVPLPTRNVTLLGVEVATQLLAQIQAPTAVVADLKEWHNRALTAAEGGAGGRGAAAAGPSSRKRARSSWVPPPDDGAAHDSSDEEGIWVGSSSNSSSSDDSGDEGDSSEEEEEEEEEGGPSIRGGNQQPLNGPLPPAFSGVIPMHLPYTLPTQPPLDLHPALKGSRYGLSELNRLKVPGAKEGLHGVREELQQMEVFSTTPINTKRISFTALGAETWTKLEGGIMCFLGFVLLQVKVMPSLVCYMDGQALVLYLAYLMHVRGVGKATLAFHVDTASKVMEWLKADQKVMEVNAGRMEEYLKWLQTLNQQIRHNVVQPREGKGVTDLQEKGRWLDAKLLLKEVQHVVDAAMQALSIKEQQGGPNTVALAAQVMNAALCALLFGYVPPIRPSILISLVMPTHKGPCIHPDCQYPLTCKGNRLELCQQAEGETGGGQSMLLVAPHHKNTKRWKGKVISFELPPEVFTLLNAHSQWGYHVLTRCLPVGSQQKDPRVFVLESTGQPLKKAQVSQVWCRVALSRVQARFGPQMGRSIFVHHLKSSDTGVGGLDHTAAAHVMGNSLSTWNAVYDKSYNRRRAQGAVNAMKQWREQVLSEED